MNDDEECIDRKVEPVQETEEDLCRSLWLAVAIQALIDATGKGGNSLNQAQAIEWLKGKGGITSDFACVCDLAGIDFERTRKKFEQVIKREVESIDFRCMKKAGANNRSNENRKRFFRRAERNARNRRLNHDRKRLHDLAHGRAECANDNFINQPMEKIV